MRRIILGIIFTFIITFLPGCNHAEEEIVVDYTPIESFVAQVKEAPEETAEKVEAENVEAENAEIETTETETTKTGNTTKTDGEKVTDVGKSETQVSETKPSKPENKPASDYNSYETIELEKVEEADVPQINEEIKSNTSHATIGMENYYQYSFLSDNAKRVYKAICESAKKGETVVDLSSRGCSTDMINNIYQAVIADNPQFFFLTKNYVYTYNSRNQTVENIVLMYTDGSIQDEYDEKGNMVVTANRSKINSQIQAFNQRISEIVSKIPVDATAIQKEKMIYDYIQDSVIYDKNTEALLKSSSNVISPSFGAYGAACNRLAVCEGYAELFQYLCYCVGINVTPINGTAAGGSHMWNAIKLDSAWYMLDVTWDDPAQDGLHGYHYFNLTASEMAMDHSADASNLHVPSCTSMEYAPYRHFAIYIESMDTAPANYQSVIDWLAGNGDKYLCVYAGNQSGDMNTYISEQIYSETSEVQKYILQKGYGISFESTYYNVRDYYYIPIK